MWKGKLGGLPIELYTYQKKGEIVPSLKGATRSRIDRRMRILEANEIFKTNEILEDLFYREVITKYQVHLKDSQAAPTEWADLLEDIKTEYSGLSKSGNTHYGRYQTIEPLFKYLLYKQLLKYPECMQRINPMGFDVTASENAAWMLINPDKYRNIKRLLKTRKVQFQIPQIQDLAFVQVFFALDKWRKSFSLPCIPIVNVVILYSLLHITLRKGNALRDRVAKERLADKRGIYPCLIIYAIKTLERDENKKILKNDKVLCEIWDLPFSTFKDRMSELRSLDS